jgi:hypothetical protein
MDTWGNGKGTSVVSVDHLDRNPLNNRYDNLRIATMQEQQKNSKGTADDGTKRERNHSARALPAGITQDMMKKYVVYYFEYLDKEHTRSREFFKVEKHPKLEKPWMTSKSEKVSLLQKLEAANKVVSDLDKGIFPEDTAPAAVLPKYYRSSLCAKNHTWYMSEDDPTPAFAKDCGWYCLQIIYLKMKL